MNTAKPNILLIISDQHSGLVTTQAGYPHITTPGIDKLASQGTSYTRCYCTNPLCVPARAALMTGMMPSKSWPHLCDYPCISTILGQAGYQTAYFGKWHVGYSKIDEVADWHQFDEYQEFLDDSRTTDLSVEYLKRNHGKPFFMVTSLLNPHDCCELARRITGIKDPYHDGGVEEQMDLDSCPPLPANFAIPPDEPDGISTRRDPGPDNWKTYRVHPNRDWCENEWRQYMYGYDRLVEKVDRHILRILNTLDAEGLGENTLVIYTSDHGDGHASHKWNQKMTFYEESVNVPFIMAWKGRISEGVIDRDTLMNNGIDIFPSICAAAGIEPSDSLHGENLFDRGESVRDYVVSEMLQTNRKSDSPEKYIGRMVVSTRFKYILFDCGENREQLFDLASDPGECFPVTSNPAYGGALDQHRARLKEWISATQDDFPVEKIPGNGFNLPPGGQG